jgi:opacity protein-like surface antigen
MKGIARSVVYVVRVKKIFCAGLLLLMFPTSPYAAAHEWYFGGFIGGAFPQDWHIEKKGVNLETVRFEVMRFDKSLKSSLAGGAKAGFCPGFFAYLCVEIDFDHFRPDMKGPGLPKSFESIGDFVEQAPNARFDYRVNNLGLNLIGRLPLLRDPEYYLGGRLHPYIGVGPSFNWTRAQARDCLEGSGLSVTEVPEGIVLSRFFIESRCNRSDTDFSVGVQALAGLKFFITKNLAIFTEYKFKQWHSHFSFTTGPLVPEVILGTKQQLVLKPADAKFNVHLIYVGIAFHF